MSGLPLSVRCRNLHKWHRCVKFVSTFVPHRNKAKEPPTSMFEPDYLKLLEPEIPQYPVLNVQMKGYHFPYLERFADYVSRTATHMGIDVVNSWPTPGMDLQIKSYVPGTTAIQSEYKLTLFERNVQLSNMSSTVAPIFLQTIQRSLPEGVQLSVHQHEKAHEEERFIPDLELEELTRAAADLSKSLSKSVGDQ